MMKKTLLVLFLLAIPVSGLLTLRKRRLPSLSVSANSDVWVLDQASSRSEAILLLRRLKENGSADLFNSTRLVGGDRRATVVELKVRTGIKGDVAAKVGLRGAGGGRSDRLAAGLGGAVLFAMGGGILGSEYIPGPPWFRYLTVSLICFSPYVFLLLSLNLPKSTDWALAQVQRMLFPAYQQRLLYHEAGHFLVGYLLGLPVEGYTTNAATNAVNFWPLSDIRLDRGAVLRVLGVKSDGRSTASGPPARLTGRRRVGESWAERVAREQDEQVIHKKDVQIQFETSTFFARHIPSVNIYPTALVFAWLRSKHRRIQHFLMQIFAASILDKLGLFVALIIPLLIFSR